MSEVLQELAPVVVFAYRRLDHVDRMLASLEANPLASRTRLYVYCDAARSRTDESNVARVRERVASTTGFASLQVVLRATNFGLARSVIEGTTEVLERHGRAIVVEDDLVLSRHFLQYMNEGLNTYADEQRVASIHGYVYPVKGALPETFFLRGADCWGWATWSRAWSHFEPDSNRLLSELRERQLTQVFDLDDSFPFMRMLEDQAAGRNDSWAIRWHASCFLKGLLTLYPGRSLVENIGHDSSGTHSETTDMYSLDVSQTPVNIHRQPLEEATGPREAIKRFHRQNAGLFARARRMVLRVTKFRK